MGKKKHKKKPTEISLLSFVEAPSAKEREILEFISGRGRVSKSELWSWVKRRGLSPASFYRALTKLLREGAVKRVFDEDLEEYVFYVND